MEIIAIYTKKKSASMCYHRLPHVTQCSQEACNFNAYRHSAN